jgi:DNA-binding NarL/FixJ family response regulator
MQATRYIKEREHPPVVIIVTSDDSAGTKASAEEAGADGFVIKDGNLRHRLLTTLQDLFEPNRMRRARTTTAIKSCPPPNKTSELSLCSR